MKAQANRPHCQKPSACDAKGNGHCRRCHMTAAASALHADPEFKARMKALHAGPKGVEIPKWVPGDLHDEYLEYAAMNGEEFAASHCRRLLREARAARTEQIEESARQAASHRQ